MTLHKQVSPFYINNYKCTWMGIFEKETLHRSCKLQQPVVSVCAFRIAYVIQNQKKIKIQRGKGFLYDPSSVAHVTWFMIFSCVNIYNSRMCLILLSNYHTLKCSYPPQPSEQCGDQKQNAGHTKSKLNSLNHFQNLHIHKTCKIILLD